jgi:ATP-binding cassette, subfamily B, bacterial PglK
MRRRRGASAAGRYGGPAAPGPTDDRPRDPPPDPRRAPGAPGIATRAGPEDGTPMLATYRQLLDLMTPGERRRFWGILGIIMFSGLAEMLSVASILPFIAVLSNPDMLERNGRVAAVYHALGFASRESFLIFLGSAVFAIVVFGLLFSTFTHYVIYRFTGMRAYSIGRRLLRGYLLQPYTWFLNRHSATLGASVLTEVNHVVMHAMQPAMMLLPQAVVAIFLIALLVAVRPVAALIAAGLIVGSYVVIYFSVRRYLSRLGQDKHRTNQRKFRIAGEALGGIKDVKLMGLETSYLGQFDAVARRLAVVLAQSKIVGELPRNLLKAVALGGILFFILFLLVTGDSSLGDILPILGLYAFAGIRLFPALQQVYAATTAMRFAQPVLDRLHKDMAELDAVAAHAAAGPAAGSQPPLRLREWLEFADVHYAYPKAERPAVNGLSLGIAANTTVGIVGGTGAGKTTAVDLILGLLLPQSGEIRVDGAPITAVNRRAWQDNIGYVPQQIFLTDDTVSANIAFGLPKEKIDQAAVERAARTAELHDFVTQELPKGYDTAVGERGVRLSGGQRQRIGIARALYHDPDVLILDEATSALDNLTERAVMDAVKNLGHAKTIVLIAHRLTTVQDCDTIFMLERGRLVAQGSYDDLLESSHEFRAMAAGAA